MKFGISKLNPVRYVTRLRDAVRLLHRMEWRISRLEEGIGRLQAMSQHGISSDSIHDYEFRVFSQAGEDGIIQHLLQSIQPIPNVFIEFGVENYLESCTRFVLVNNNWRGLIADGSLDAIKFIQSDSIYWRHDLTAVNAFITRENINQIITDNGIEGEIGLLVVDIDGNDYWVWEAITSVDPVIVVCEYNSLFGPDAKVSIPYVPDFTRTSAHYSNLYFGASLAALEHLGRQRGYILVGSNRIGSNAFFVKADRRSSLQPLTAQQAYVRSGFREGRDENGRLTFARFEQSRALIRNMPLINVATGQSLTVGDLERVDYS